MSTTSFSRSPVGPIAPGSSPPWPGSIATTTRRSMLRCSSAARGAGTGLDNGAGTGGAADGLGRSTTALAGTVPGTGAMRLMNSPSASCTLRTAMASARSRSWISVASGSGASVGCRSSTSLCWYAATGASVNCCGATGCFKSSTSRTTRGRFWPTLTPAMNGSSALTLPTSSRSAGLSSNPSMSITSRGGLSVRNWRADSGWSLSIVTRLYSVAGHTRTATMAAPSARSARPRLSTSAPWPSRRSAVRRLVG